MIDDDRMEAAERVAQLMRCIGCAMWQLQALEDTLAMYVVVRLRMSQGGGLEQATALTAELARLELGKLIAQIRCAAILPNEPLEKLELVRKERNWLVHRAWRENRAVVSSQPRLAALLGRLTLLAQDALALNKQMASEIEAFVTSAGVPKEYIDREADHLRQSWESSV